MFQIFDSSDTGRLKNEISDQIEKENAYNQIFIEKFRKSKIAKSQKIHALQDAKLMIQINNLKMKKHELEEFERVVSQNCIKLNDIVKLLEKSENEKKVAESRREKLFNSVSKIEKKMKLIEIDVKSTYKERTSHFSHNMDQIIHLRLEVQEKISKVNSKLSTLQERKRMVREDLTSRLKRKTELLMEREEIEAYIEQLKEEDDEEIRLLIEEQKSGRRISDIKSQISQRKSLVLTLEKDVISMNRRIGEYEKIHKEVKSRVTNGLRKRDEEMKSIKSDIDVIVEAMRRNNLDISLKRNFKISSKNFKSDFFLKDIIRDIGKGIEIEVLKQQLVMVEKEMENFERSFQRKIEQFKKPILENHNDTRLENFQTQLMKKLSSLENWKNGLKRVIEENENDDDQQYLKIYTIFKEKEMKRLIKGIVSEKDFSPRFENLLDQLISLLVKYERIAGKKSKIFISEKETMEDCELNILELVCHKEACETLIETFFEEIKDFIKEKKDIEGYCEENRYALQSILTNSAEERFKILETSRAEDFKKISRTYGNKRLQEIKTQQRSELIARIVQEKKEKFSKILKYQQKLQKIENRLNHNEMEKETEKIQNQIQSEIIIQKGIKKKFQEEEKNLVDEEEELVNKLNIIQLKQKDVLNKRFEGIRDLIEKHKEDRENLDKCNIFIHEVQERIKGLKSEIEQFDRHKEMIQTKKARIILEIEKLKNSLKVNEIKHKEELKRLSNEVKKLSQRESIDSENSEKKVSLNELFLNLKKRSNFKDRAFLSDLSNKYLTKTPFTPEERHDKNCYESPGHPEQYYTQRMIRDKLKMNRDKENKKTHKIEISSPKHEKKLKNDVKITPFPDDLTTRVDTTFKKTNAFSNKTTFYNLEKKRNFDFGNLRMSFNCISGHRKDSDDDLFKGVLNKRKSDGMVKYRNQSKNSDSEYMHLNRILQEKKKNKINEEKEEIKIYDKLFGGPRITVKGERCKNRASLDLKNFLREKKKNSQKNKRMIKSQRVEKAVKRVSKSKSKSKEKLSNQNSQYYLDKYNKMKKRKKSLRKNCISNSLRRKNSRARRRKKSVSRDLSKLRERKKIGHSLNLQTKPNSTQNSLGVNSLLQKTNNEEKLKYLKNPRKMKFQSRFLEKTFTSLYQKTQINVRTILEGNKTAKNYSELKTAKLSFKNCSDSWNCKKHKKYYKIDNQKAGFKEKEIFRSLRPLLQGSHFYKKFTSSSLRRENFNPRYCIDKPPESCGYGMRFFRINLYNKKLEIMNSNRLVCEKSIKFKDFLRINNQQYEDLKKDGLNKIDMIPFEIIVCKEGAIKLVSLSYDDFKNWVRGLSTLMKNLSKLGRLANKVKCCCV